MTHGSISRSNPALQRTRQKRRAAELYVKPHMSSKPSGYSGTPLAMKLGITERSVCDIVAEGTANRLRAIVLTTVSTVVGLLPLAYGIGGSDPYMGPMALALGWGLLFATPLTLLLVPCIFLIGDDVGRLFRRRVA